MNRKQFITPLVSGSVRWPGGRGGTEFLQKNKYNFWSVKNRKSIVLYFKDMQYVLTTFFA